MKLLLCNLCLVCFFSICQAQPCNISGVVDSSSKELQLVLLNADGQYSVPSIKIPVSASFSFRKQLLLEYPVFAELSAGGRKRRLLLSPGRDLKIVFNPGLENTVLLSGKAAPENELLRNSIFDSTPFFMKGKWNAEKKEYEEERPYTKIKVDEWNNTIMRRVESDVRITSGKIFGARIPLHIKQILSRETVYAYQCYLNDFTQNYLRWANNPDRDSLLQLVMEWKAQPDSNALISGFYSNMMLQLHCQYALIRLVRSKKGNGPVGEYIAQYLQMPLKEIERLVGVYGERYILDWLYSRNYMPYNIRDKILFNKIMDAADGGSLNACKYLLDTMKQYFPNSSYLAKAEAQVAMMEAAYVANAGNIRILYRTSDSISSIDDLVRPYRGKIVYLDIWGTWCGPCKMEMDHVGELKKKFSGKDIVFLYLDMDDPIKEEAWKEYVQYRGIEGEHYRMDQTAIENIWAGITKAGGRSNFYPTYVLFDRNGDIITATADRPSDGEKLYELLNKVL